MKAFVASLLICLVNVSNPVFTTARRESCSCVADDNSCSVNATCPRGCLAFCPSDNCRVYCVPVRRPTPSPTPRVRPQATFNDRIETPAGPMRDVAIEVISPIIPTHTSYSPTVQRASLQGGRLIHTSDTDIQKGREDVYHLRKVRTSLLHGERMSVCFSNISAGDLAAELSFITGLQIVAERKDAVTGVNYSGKSVTLGEMLSQVSELSGVQFLIK